MAPGTRIGVYELTGHIGSGGMAEVYRARDTTLGREVAIKVLPEALSRDPARLARFERELEVSALGGPPRPLASSLHGGDVSHDGRHIATFQMLDGTTHLVTISRQDGTVNRVCAAPRSAQCRWPRWSVDDREIAFLKRTIPQFVNSCTWCQPAAAIRD